jgi:hypothetical protein
MIFWTPAREDFVHLAFSRNPRLQLKSPTHIDPNPTLKRHSGFQ